MLLLGRGIAASPIGWQLLQSIVSLLKAQPGRRYLAPDYSTRSSTAGGAPTLQLVPTDSWHLLQGLLADVVLDLLAAQAADAATAASSSGSSGAAVSSPTAGPGRPGARRTSSEWDAWTLVSQVRCAAGHSTAENSNPMQCTTRLEASTLLWWDGCTSVPASWLDLLPCKRALLPSLNSPPAVVH